MLWTLVLYVISLIPSKWTGEEGVGKGVEGWDWFPFSLDGEDVWLVARKSKQEESEIKQLNKSPMQIILFIFKPPFFASLYHIYVDISSLFASNHAEGVSVCAKRNFIYGEAVTSLGEAHFIWGKASTSFIYVRLRRNDVSLRLNDVACVARKWCCVLRTQMKKSKSFDLDFLAGAEGIEPATRGFGGDERNRFFCDIQAFLSRIGKLTLSWCSFDAVTTHLWLVTRMHFSWLRYPNPENTEKPA